MNSHIVKLGAVEGEYMYEDREPQDCYESKTEFVYRNCTLGELVVLRNLALVEAPQEALIIKEYIKKFYPGVDF